jgi:hypothetical protein
MVLRLCVSCRARQVTSAEGAAVKKGEESSTKSPLEEEVVV